MKIITRDQSWHKYRTQVFQFSLSISLLIVLVLFNYTKYESEVMTPTILEYEEELEEIPIRTVHTPKVKKLKPIVVEPLPDEIISPPEEEIEYVDELPEEIDVELFETDFEEKLPMKISTQKEEILAPEIPPLIEEVEEIKTVFIAQHMPAYSICQDEVEEGKRRDCTGIKVTQDAYKYIDYPAIARENGIEGTVVIEFLIDKNGIMKEPKILKDIGGGCGKEALKAVSKLNDWTAGKQNGKAVHVLYRIPIRFQLN